MDEGGGGDGDSQVLTIPASSSNKELIPDASLIVYFNDIDFDAVDGSFEIIPAKDQNGTSVITLIVDDGTAQVSQQFNVTVDAVNDLPVISPIENMTVNEDDSSADIKISTDVGGGNDEESQDISLTFQNSNPSVISNDNISSDFRNDKNFEKSGMISLYPRMDAVGKIEITVTVSDGFDHIEESFFITVKPVNDPPEFSLIESVDILEDEKSVSIEFSVDEGGGADEDIQILKITASSSNEEILPEDNIIEFDDDENDAVGGIITLKRVLCNGTNIRVLLTIDGQSFGKISFNINSRPVLHDEAGVKHKIEEPLAEPKPDESPVIVRQETVSANKSPVAFDTRIETFQNMAASSIIEGSDPKGETLTFEIVENPEKGRVKLDAAQGIFKYCPTKDASGKDKFTFKVNDGEKNSKKATVTVIIQKN